jgi:hypothetical protein
MSLCGLTEGDCVSAYMMEGRIAFSLEKGRAAEAHSKKIPVGECPAESEPVFVGMRVQHIKFGIGTIRKIEGDGENRKVIVWFANAGPKKLMLRFAGFERI